MAKIAKIKWNNINGGTDRTDLYPVTSDRAVYNADNKTMREIIRVRGVVNISTYFTYDGTPEVLTLEKAIAKITEENRCPGFLATILTTEGWFTFRYSANTIDDATWSNTDNWIVFHAGRLEVLATSPLHLALSLKNYIYTLQGYIDAVNANQDGYLTKEDYQKFLQALEDIKALFNQMSAVENRVTNIEGNITDINKSIGDINNNINSLGDSIEEINKLIEELRAALASLESSISNLKIATIVDELPTENINTNTIYLVPAANQENLNKYAEYVYADGEWEKLGEVQLETDLTGYVKEEDLDDLVGKLGYIKAADIPDSPVTSVLISNDSDDSTGILNISPDEKQVGDVEFKIGVDKDALNKYIKNYPNWPDIIVDNSINIWFALAESEINMFMINRSSLYPSKSNANTGKAQITPSIGDIVFITFITDVSSSMPTCSGQGVYVITAISDDTYTVTRDEADGKYAWWSFNTGSDSTVSSVQLTNEDDTTGILVISPTEAQSGKVVINLKVSEENLKNWIKNNLDLSAGVSSVKVTNDSSPDMTDCLAVTPTSATSGDVNLSIGLISSAFQNWIENLYPPVLWKAEKLEDEPTVNVVTSDSDRYYNVEVTPDNKLVVNVPWTGGGGGTDITQVVNQATAPLTLEGSIRGSSLLLGGSVAIATEDSLGVVMPCAVARSEMSVNSITSMAERTYGVVMQPNGKLVVNVPWTDTTYTAGVTEIKATSLSDILTAMPTGYTTGQVDMQIGVDEDALISWLKDHGFGGSEESNGASVWIGEGNQNISPYGSIARSNLYPSSDYGTPKVGDTVLWFYINADGVQTVVIAEVTGISGSIVSTSTKLSWTIGSDGGAVDTVQIKHTDDDATNILTINPTDAQSGSVTVSLGISESDLKEWLSKNGYGASSAGVTEIKATSLSDIITVQPTSYSDGQVNVQIGVDEDKLKEWLGDNGYSGGEVITGESLSSATYYPSPTAKLITGTIDRSSVRINRPNGTASSVKGHEIHMIFKANMDTTVTIYTSSAMVAADGVTSISLSEGEYVEISIICDGTTFYTRTGISNA